MTTLLILIGVLLAGQLVCCRLARKQAGRMMAQPPDEWDGEDVDRWLDLIEPFPLHGPTRQPRG